MNNIETTFPRFPLRQLSDNYKCISFNDMFEKTSWDASTYYVFEMNHDSSHEYVINSLAFIAFPHNAMKTLKNVMQNKTKQEIQTKFVFLAHVSINTLLSFTLDNVKEEIVNEVFKIHFGGNLEQIIIRYYIFLEELWSFKNQNIHIFDNKTVLQSFLQRIFTAFVLNNRTPLALYISFKKELNLYFNLTQQIKAPTVASCNDLIEKNLTLDDYLIFIYPLLQIKEKRVVLTYCKFYTKNLQYKYARNVVETLSLVDEAQKEENKKYFPEYFYSDFFYISLKKKFKPVNEKNT